MNASATHSTVTVGATTVFTVDQTLAALIVHDGGVTTLGGPAQSPAFADGFGESLGGIAALLGLRRRRP